MNYNLPPSLLGESVENKDKFLRHYLRQRLQLSPHVPSLRTRIQSAWSQPSRVPQSGPQSLRWDGSTITGRLCSQDHILSFTELENLKPYYSKICNIPRGENSWSCLWIYQQESKQALGQKWIHLSTSWVTQLIGPDSLRTLGTSRKSIFTLYSPSQGLSS